MSDISSNTDSTAAGSHIRTLVSCTACWFLAQMSYYGQTQMLGPLMSRYERGEIDVGIVFTQELTVYALAALFVAGPLPRPSPMQPAAARAPPPFTAQLTSA